jgi:hypothetical protein
MQPVINLSLKKAGTSYVHNILRAAGFPAGVEKEYYVLPRHSKHFFGLLDEISGSWWNKEDNTYFCASRTTRLSENDKKFLDQIFATHAEHVRRFQIMKDDPARVIRESIERLHLLGSCYGESVFFVSDPNLMLDLYTLSSNCLKLRPDGSSLPVSEVNGLRFFSVVREPVSLAVSLVGLQVSVGMTFDKIDAAYLRKVADRSRFFAINKALESVYGFKTKLFRFDSVCTDPAGFLTRLDTEFSVGRRIFEDVSDVPNPNPGGALAKSELSALRSAFESLLAKEVAAYAEIEP